MAFLNQLQRGPPGPVFTKNHEDQDQLILFFVFIIYALNLYFVGQKCKAYKAYINAKNIEKNIFKSKAI